MGLLDPPSVPSRFNRSGPASALPAASAGLAGVTYRYTDVGSAIYSGRVDQCDGTQWVTIVPPSGTSAPRTPQEFYVTDYGVAPLGIADSAAAVRSAVLAAAAYIAAHNAPASVVIPVGSYLWSDAVNVCPALPSG